MSTNTLDVVIASDEEPEETLRCLRSGQSGSGGIRWVVASSRPLPAGIDLGHDAEWATVPGAGIPALRAAGFARARSGRVTFTEGFCRLAPGWAAAWRDAPPFDVATGSVAAPSDASALELAAILFEYGPFLAPIGPGRPGRAAGNNFAASRTALAVTIRDGELHEIDLGPPSLLLDRAVTIPARRETPRSAILERLRCGWEYGMLRKRGRPATSRLRGFLMGPAILPAQVVKQAAQLLRRPDRLGISLDALPWLLLLCTAWGLGEWLGWAFGPSRQRCGRAARPAASPAAPIGSPPARCRPGPAPA